MDKNVQHNRIVLESGVIISFESTDAVPDTTADAGPNQIELHEEAQKNEKDANAEYDASLHVDSPINVEKANESSFFGVILKHRSNEAFAKVKSSFQSVGDFFKSNEVKAAVATAKSWAEKKKLSFASIKDFPEQLKKRGFTPKVINGATVAYLVEKNRLYADVLFKNSQGKVTTKSFATVKISGGENEKKGESKPAVEPEKKLASPVTVNNVLAKEADNPIDNAFADVTDPVTPPDAPSAEPAAPSETEEPAISPEEIDGEVAQGQESYSAVISRLLRSREEADAAASTIEDKDIDEVVGDDEGSEVESEGESDKKKPDEKKSDGDPDTEEDKSLESLFKDLGF